MKRGQVCFTEPEQDLLERAEQAAMLASCTNGAEYRQTWHYLADAWRDLARMRQRIRREKAIGHVSARDISFRP
jgi:hypothetical protein